MINLRVGFPRSIVGFLLQVPRIINGMKYHINFLYCVVVVLKGQTEESTEDDA